MQIINSILEFQKVKTILKGSIGFVPTMGALHKGHLSLVQRSKSSCDYTVASIFINPKQFAPDEDFKNYPRTINDDIIKLESLGVDILFMPLEQEIYNNQYPNINYSNDMFYILEGVSRPSFFDGVCIVVAKLFDIIQPTDAFFGEKDFQQLRIIEQMTCDLNYDVNIVSCPIIRESNGLAMSSRNQYLSSYEKDKAKIIFDTLKLGLQSIKDGNKDISRLKKILIQNIDRFSEFRLDYLEIVDYKTLKQFDNFCGSQFIICIAAYISNVRLIDNINYLFSDDLSR